VVCLLDRLRAANWRAYHSKLKTPEWRNWYTHQTQNLARFTPHESSSLSSGTNCFKQEFCKGPPSRALKLSCYSHPLMATPRKAFSLFPDAFGSEPASVRPPLKWAGGKRWQLSELRRYWLAEKHRRLVEPFCGGLAVTLGLMPSCALLNDINPHLINFYKQLNRGLVSTLRQENKASVFYSYRREFNHLLKHGKGNTPEAAMLFYYLNRTGFNGLCRFNRSGEFNVPFGRYDKIGYRKDFLEYRHVFSNWKFTNVDFEKLPLRPDDFVYADPPYDVEFRQYSKDGFGWSEQERTAEWLAKHPGPVVLSNQATARIVTLYRKLGYGIKFLHAPRRISCNGDRTPAEEVLAIRNLRQ
jgi:DNA adenine methylase